MLLPIVLYGDPVLRVKCRPITEVTQEIRDLAANMLETMYDARGVGLAAPQIGIPLQIAVIDVSHDPEAVSYLRINGEERSLADSMPLIFLNPKLNLGKDKDLDHEGCLSIPGLRDKVRRSSDISVTFTNLEGETVTLECDGLLGRAFQHEIDHLNGILFIDRLSAAAKLGTKRKLKWLMEEWAEDIRAGRRPGESDERD
ncbi:peptide deformylase [Phragmitibacter flavus]|uniref:Peptide deformylase n=1 Tax=Phragmitibacter flavus TaxID=2576071 RepID=A0A5R8KKH7_9BACT|nr:peptide deformylase [Phragmitibacter flavus]TLD72119.1 peptide deformylase [Phragmitibacter flavus]